VANNFGPKNNHSSRHWKDHFKNDLRSDQDHRLKIDLRSDQDHVFKKRMILDQDQDHR
jgi:hypothetical protein